MADVFELVLVLVGPKGMDVRVGIRRAEHRSRCGASLLLRVVVVLDAGAPEYGVKMVRHVARGVDVRQGGLTAFVDKDPAALLARRRDPIRCHRIYPRADDNEVAGDAVAVGRDDGFDAFGPLKGYDLVSRQELHPVTAVDVGELCTELPAQHPLKGSLAGEYGGHPNPELSQ